MRRIGYLLLALLPLGGASAVAQAPGRPRPVVVRPDAVVQTLTLAGAAEPASRVSPDDMIARLLTFDRDGDARLGMDELAERMRPSLAGADASGDGLLDVEEIRRAAAAPSTSDPTQFHGIPFGRYGFADETGFSTRSHIEGVLEDLRIAPAARERARDIAFAHLAQVETEAFGEFVAAMEGSLDATRLGNLRAALERLRVASPLAANSSRQQLLQVTAMEALLKMQQASLSKEDAAAAAAAFEQLKARLRLDEQDRRALAAKLEGVLTPEERENFQAAVARRPVVQRGTGSAPMHFVISPRGQVQQAAPALLQLIDGRPIAMPAQAAPAVLVPGSPPQEGFAIVR
jgi:hypothetical protein